jgi:hypothetical protein
MLSYIVFFKYPGKHYIWVRGSGDTNNFGIGNSDSIHVGLNGTIASSAYRIDQFPTEWTWSRHTPSDPLASLNVVNTGVNIVNFWMREDGLAIDKFVITSDPNFVPTGFGPEVTDGTVGYAPPASSDDLDTIQVNDNPVESDSTNAMPVESDPTTDVPVETATTNADPVTSDATSGSTDSSNGIFGGSASKTALLAVFALCLFRVCRFKRVLKS